MTFIDITVWLSITSVRGQVGATGGCPPKKVIENS